MNSRILSVCVLTLAVSTTAFGQLAVPTGERDIALARCAPQSSVLYLEWSDRTDGKEGGKGIDGLAADEEVRMFVKHLEAALTDLASNQNSEFLVPLFKTVLTEPGCVFVDMKRDAVKPLTGFNPNDFLQLLPGLQAGIILTAGEKADVTAKAIEQLLSQIPLPSTGEGLERRSFAGLPIPIILHRHHNHIILAAGHGTLDRIIEGLDKTPAGLNGNQRFTAAVEATKTTTPSSFFWLDVRDIRSMAMTVIGEQRDVVEPIIKALGADRIDSLSNVSGVEDGDVVSRLLLKTDGSTSGVLALTQGRSITANDFAATPADSDFTLAMSVNLSKTYAAVRESLKNVEPDAVQQMDAVVQALADELKFSIVDELFPAVDDVWVLHSSRNNWGAFFSPLSLSVGLKDPKTVAKALEAVFQVAKGSLPDDAVFDLDDDVFGGDDIGQSTYRAIKQIFRGSTVYSIEMQHRYGMTMSPTVSIVGNRLLLAMQPQAIKAQIRSLAAGNDNNKYLSTLVMSDFKSRGNTIGYGRLKKDAAIQGYYWMAWPGRFLYMMNRGRGGFNLTQYSIPSSQAFRGYVSDAKLFVISDKNGITLETRETIPMSLLLGFMVQMQSMSMIGMMF